MDVSVIIVNYNVRYFLEQCIIGIQAGSKNLKVEIIVVDNNSSDDSCEMLQNSYSEVFLIRNSENVGFSKANNQAVEKAKGKFVLLLNPDTLIAEDTLEKLIKLNSSKTNIGITGVKLIDGSGSFAPESKRGIPTAHATFNKLFGITSKRTGKYYATHLKPNDSGVVEILSGSFMFLKKEIYDEVGGFDETFFMYGEDIDLCYRVLLKGYRNYYLADTKAIHYKGESTKKDIKYLEYFNNAMELFYEKHYKLNIIYDFFMKGGIKFWYLLKYFNHRFKREPIIKVDKIQFFKETEFLFFCAEKNYLIVNNKNQNILKIKEFLKLHKIDTIVFDNTYLTNKTILNRIEALQKMHVSFKIRPKGTNFLIGSPNPNRKGEVKIITS